MKRFMGVLGALLLGSATASAELLTNPDLELGGADDATGWTIAENDLSGDAEGPVFFQPWAAQSGARGIWFKTFLGNASFTPNPFAPPVDADIYQDVPGSAGDAYTLSAWFDFEQYCSVFDPFSGSDMLLAMDFLGAGDSVISSVVLDVDAAYGQPVGRGGFRQFSVNGIAPAGTVEVRARASLIDGIFEPLNPQSAFVDNFSLVPEPSTLLMAAGLAGLMLRRRS